MATNSNLNVDGGAETLQTWNKFSSSAKKSGFRDGVADGRNTMYQKSFDEGYIEGFKNGFVIGKYKGALRSNLGKDPDLDNTRKGWCQICTNEKLLQSTTSEIIRIQTEFSNSILEKIHSTYSPTVNVTLEKKLA